MKNETIDGIAVHCAHTRIALTSSLKPHPRNPNTHPAKQIEIFGKVVRTLGWRAPIVVSRRSGFVIKGHGRLDAAKLLEMPMVPVDFQEYESEATEWADMLADNRIAELAETDDEELKKLIQERARVAQIFAAAVEGGMRTLKMDGLEKIMLGLTDIKMVRSVCIK